mmetsp:Transcript_8273/g.16777  ORF Transcript_8273/g.16777 Transcript_8273/m.16777 type:complete len:143 (+) Transcript_8273:1223-1651(+)
MRPFQLFYTDASKSGPSLRLASGLYPSAPTPNTDASQIPFACVVALLMWITGASLKETIIDVDYILELYLQRASSSSFFLMVYDLRWTYWHDPHGICVLIPSRMDFDLMAKTTLTHGFAGGFRFMHLLLTQDASTRAAPTQN